MAVTLICMTEVTQVLSQIEKGDPSAAEQLLPLVYEELRKLAAVRLATEKPGQTLQPTALVHEAYLRLLGSGEAVASQLAGINVQRIPFRQQCKLRKSGPRVIRSIADPPYTTVRSCA